MNEELKELNEDLSKVTNNVVVTAMFKVNVDMYSLHVEEVERKIREVLMVGTKDFDGDVTFDYNISITHV